MRTESSLLTCKLNSFGDDLEGVEDLGTSLAVILGKL